MWPILSIMVSFIKKLAFTKEGRTFKKTPKPVKTTNGKQQQHSNRGGEQNSEDSSEFSGTGTSSTEWSLELRIKNQKTKQNSGSCVPAKDHTVCLQNGSTTTSYWGCLDIPLSRGTICLPCMRSTFAKVFLILYLSFLAKILIQLTVSCGSKFEVSPKLINIWPPQGKYKQNPDF